MNEQPTDPQTPPTPPSDRAQPVTVGRTSNVSPRPPLDPAERYAEQLQKVDEAIKAAGTVREKIDAAIGEVYDPEIPVNIYELGLIYEVQIDEANNVNVIMTLTSPACPAAQELPMNVKRNISRVAEVNDVDVDITFDPPWSPERMSDAAKLQLGFM